MLKKLALGIAAGATLAAGVALTPTEASACWRCGPYAYYYGPGYYPAYYPPYSYPVYGVYPAYPAYYGWRRPYYSWGWRRAWANPYWRVHRRYW